MCSALGFVLKTFPKVNIIVAGEYNVHFNNKSDDNMHRVVQLFTSFGLHQQVIEPTHTGGNCLDNIFSNYCCIQTKVECLGFSDHYALKANFTIQGIEQNKNPMRLYSNNKYKTWIDHISKETWIDVYRENSAEYKYTIFHKSFLYYYDMCFPQSKKKNRPETGSWITPEVVKVKDRLRFYFEVKQRYPTEGNKKIYKEYRAVYNNVLSISKKQYYKNRLEKTDNYSKTVWDIINTETGRKNKLKITPENISANELNSFYITHAKSLTQNLSKSSININSYLDKKLKQTDSMFIKPVDFYDIKRIINKLKNKKTEDIFGVSVFSMKRASEFVIPPMVDIVNACLEEGTFPSQMKLAKIIPLYKKGEPSLPHNFRQISILPVFSKVLESVVFEQFVAFLDKHCIIIPRQFGFRKNVTTSDAILTLVKCIRDAFEKRNKFIGLFADLTAAFDCVNRKFLLDKAYFYGIRGVAFKLLQSYLEGRYQVVCCNGDSMSAPMLAEIGVPQGSVLGPLLFLLYVNDLPQAFEIFGKNIQNIESIIYVDDATFGVSFEGGEDPAQLLEAMTDQAKLWFLSNQLVLNDTKTESIIFEAKTISTDVKNKIKFLGVTLDTNLLYTDHVNNICNKLNKAIYAIRRIKNTINEAAALTTYHSLFDSILRYGILVWSSAASTHLEKVFRVQKSAIRCIANLKQDESSRPYFKSLKIMTLYGLIIYQKLIYVRKNVARYCTLSHIHTHGTRSRDNLLLPVTRLARTNMEEIKLFNALPREMRLQQLGRFKSSLKKIIINAAIYNFSEFYTLTRNRENFKHYI